MTPPVFHAPVLQQEAIRLLVTDRAGVYVDATAGGGGHAAALARALPPGGSLLCLDADADAVAATTAALAGTGARVRQANFRGLREVLAEEGIGRIRGLLLDLGVSSRQLDDPARGFSFRADETLDMRMDRRQHLTAAHVANDYGEQELADVLFRYGEERRSRRIARIIVRRRPLRTTGDLRDAVAEAGSGPALVKTLARVFQAVRIEVNGELSALRRALDDGAGLLEPGGRLVVIAYHSLEDRIVKEFFRKESQTEPAPGVPSPTPRLHTLTRKPVVPEPEEISANPRSRSARLRAAERVGEVEP